MLASTVAISIPPHTSTAEAAPVCRSWGATQPPNAGSANNQLRGVAVVSTCSAWAVGQFLERGRLDDADRALERERLEGPVQPEPPGAGADLLFAVAATSTRSAWAVGSSNDGLLDRTLVLHWNGHAWKRQTSPNVAGVNNVLEGVAAISPTNVWAVGYAATNPLRTLRRALERARVEDRAQPERRRRQPPVRDRRRLEEGHLGGRDRGASPRTLVEHWNGHAWKLVKSPNPAASRMC